MLRGVVNNGVHRHPDMVVPRAEGAQINMRDEDQPSKAYICGFRMSTRLDIIS